MTLESKNMLPMKKLTFVAEDWQMPWYHLSFRCCSALANETVPSASKKEKKEEKKVYAFQRS